MQNKYRQSDWNIIVPSLRRILLKNDGMPADIFHFQDYIIPIILIPPQKFLTPRLYHAPTTEDFPFFEPTKGKVLQC